MGQEQQSNENRTVPQNIASWSDSLSKAVAASAIAIYAFGFLIVSLHNSHYGFIGTNPFRPRIFAAGAWFFFFIAVPIFTLTRFRKTTITMSWLQLAEFSYPYYFACMLLTLTSSPLFAFPDYSEWPGTPPQRWGWLLAALLIWFILLFFVERRKSPKLVPVIASVLLVLFYLQFSVRALLIAHRFEQSAVTMWFFGVGVLTVIELKVRMRGGDWEKTAFLTLAAILVFALFYYPHIKASWGGGTPVSVTVYFTKDSAIRPNQSVSAQLIEESDDGFYIVGSTENKAIYVPRSSVALVYFSDRTTDSVLLRP